MKKKTLRFTLLFLLFLVSPHIKTLFGQVTIEIHPTVEGRALSGAYYAFATEGEAIYFNPAATWYGFKNEVDLGYSTWIEDTSYFFGGYRYKINAKWAFGLSGLFFSSGTFPGIIRGAKGTFNSSSALSYQQMALFANVSHRFKIKRFYFPAGINLKIGSSASGYFKSKIYALDAGIIIPFRANLDNVPEHFYIPEKLSLTLRNVGTEITTYSTDPTKLDFIVAVGFYLIKTPSKVYNLSVDLDYSVQNGIGVGFINDIQIQKNMSVKFLTGAGLDSYSYKFSAGTTFHVAYKSFDYTVGYVLNRIDTLGITQAFSGSINFDLDLFSLWINRKKLLPRRPKNILKEVNELIFIGDYCEAILLLQELERKYGDSKEITFVLKRLIEFESSKKYTYKK